jgi:hypothetical protein
MSETRVITRVDLEKTGKDVTVKEWYEGWKPGSPADITRLEPNGYLVGMLMKLENQGYTCEMADAVTGRALRGKTVRVDLIKGPTAWHYKKFPEGWTAKTRPMSDKIVDDAEVSKIVDWCRANTWTVREWPGGYRAFLGAPLPVRDSRSILTMRRQVEAQMAIGHASIENTSQYDFALDF